MTETGGGQESKPGPEPTSGPLPVWSNCPTCGMKVRAYAPTWQKVVPEPCGCQPVFVNYEGWRIEFCTIHSSAREAYTTISILLAKLESLERVREAALSILRRVERRPE